MIPATCFTEKVRVVLAFAWKHNTLRIYFSSPSSMRLFQNIGKFGAKKCFTDHGRANTIKLKGIKGNFSGLFFFWASRGERGLPRDYLINVATYLFVKTCLRWHDVVRTNSPGCNILVSTSSCFLRFNQQECVEVVPTDNSEKIYPNQILKLLLLETILYWVYC